MFEEKIEVRKSELITKIQKVKKRIWEEVEAFCERVKELNRQRDFTGIVNECETLMRMIEWNLGYINALEEMLEGKSEEEIEEAVRE